MVPARCRCHVTLTIQELPNQPPSFTVGPNQTVLEDAGAQTVTPWATNISPGPPGEVGQTVMFSITGTRTPRSSWSRRLCRPTAR
jgi:hypothetical protein